MTETKDVKRTSKFAEVQFHEIPELAEQAKHAGETAMYCKNALEADCILVTSGGKTFAVYTTDLMDAVQSFREVKATG